MSMKNCPKCSAEFEEKGKWGLKKFCSQSCANSREQTTEVREKKSKKLQKIGTCTHCNKECSSMAGLKTHQTSCDSNPNRTPGSFFNKIHSLSTKMAQGQKNGMGLKMPNSVLDMSKRTTSKIIKRLGVGCVCCGWDKGSCDIHHIIPRSKGGSDSNDNLTLICPNCHRLAHEGKITEFVSFDTQIGDEWRKYYFAHE